MASEKLPIPVERQCDAFDRRGMVYARISPELAVLQGNASFDAVFPSLPGSDPARLASRISEEPNLSYLHRELSILRPDAPRRKMPFAVGDRIFGVDAVAVYNSRGELQEYELVAADMTEEIARREAREQLVVDLRQQVADLEAFSSTAAHDLKSPLIAIGGMLDLVLDEPETTVAFQEENLRLARKATDRGARIVNDLLEFAHIGTAKIKPEDTDLELSARFIMMDLAQLAEKQGAEIAIQKDMPHVSAHGPWVERILTNLVSNAMKYGGEHPRVEVTADLQPDGTVRCSVRDYGPGITVENQTKLFKPFSRLPGSNKMEGTGIGLSAVARMVSRMGGSIGVESTGIPGEGSVFYFTLPAFA